MRLYCEDKVYDLSICEWDSVSSQRLPDIFQDLETGYTDGLNVSREDLDSLCRFWIEECRAMTHGYQGEIFNYQEYHNQFHCDVVFTCEEVSL